MIKGQQQNNRGILLVISAMTIFSVQDVIIKLLSDDVSLFQILFYRSLLGILLILSFQKFIGQPIRLWTAYPGLSLYRGVAFFFGYGTFYFAQSKIPIANATVIFMVSPFLITIMSIVVFGSSVGMRRWGAMLGPKAFEQYMLAESMWSCPHLLAVQSRVVRHTGLR